MKIAINDSTSNSNCPHGICLLRDIRKLNVGLNDHYAVVVNAGDTAVYQLMQFKIPLQIDEGIFSIAKPLPRR